MERDNFAFGKKNYILIAISALLIVVGFVLMSGGSGENPAEFYPEIFSFVRIKLAPAVVMAGFVLMVFAILVKSNKPGDATETENN